jgi:acyl carrier protein
MDRHQLFELLLDLIEEETGERFTEVDESTDLRSGFRLDSVDMVSLILQAEVRLGVKISSSDLNGVSTVGLLLDLLQAKLAQGSDHKAA